MTPYIFARPKMMQDCYILIERFISVFTFDDICYTSPEMWRLLDANTMPIDITPAILHIQVSTPTQPQDFATMLYGRARCRQFLRA